MRSGRQTELHAPTPPLAQATICRAPKYLLTRAAVIRLLSERPARPRRHEHEEGFAIVLVLWFLALLGLAGASLLREARATHHAVGTGLAHLQAQAAADGAINLAIQNLLTPLEPMSLSPNGEFTNVRLLSRNVAIKVEDEAGKIDINTANFPLLSAMLRDVGVPPSEADFIAENTIIWRLPQSAAMRGNSDRPYFDAGRLYGPRHGPFRAVPELRLVLGMTDPIQAAVSPFITIWSDHADIDRGAASDAILGVLAAAGDSLAVSEFQRRRSGADVSAYRRNVLDHTFRIVTRVVTGDLVVERHAVVRFVPGKRKPYVILDWG